MFASKKVVALEAERDRLKAECALLAEKVQKAEKQLERQKEAEQELERLKQAEAERTARATKQWDNLLGYDGTPQKEDEGRE